MLTSQEILQNLADIADQALPFAVVWHFVALLGLLMWALDFRLPRRIDANRAEVRRLLRSRNA
jgi:hypothetical protein